MLYVEPLYIRAQNGQLPELKRVLASYGDRTVMGENLPSTLAALFKENGAASAVVAKSSQPAKPSELASALPMPAVPANGAGGMQAAAEHYNRALQALRQGDWPQFGAEMQKLGDELGQRDLHH